MMRSDVRTRIWHVNDRVTERTDCVAKEVEVCLRFLRGGQIERVSVHCLPVFLRELAVGFLICEGFRSSVENVRILAAAEDAADIRNACERYEVIVELSETVSDVAVTDDAKHSAHRKRVTCERVICEIPTLVRMLDECGTTFKKTGCTHVVGVFECCGDKHVIVEDVSRHCAIDKAVGLCIEKGISTYESVLVTSCRQTYSTMRKAANAGFPAVVSVSAPTSAAIKIAEISGITLVGFARERRFNVYANAWKLLRHGAGAI